MPRKGAGVGISHRGARASLKRESKSHRGARGSRTRESISHRGARDSIKRNLKTNRKETGPCAKGKTVTETIRRMRHCRTWQAAARPPKRRNVDTASSQLACGPRRVTDATAVDSTETARQTGPTISATLPARCILETPCGSPRDATRGAPGVSLGAPLPLPSRPPTQTQPTHNHPQGDPGAPEGPLGTPPRHPRGIPRPPP